MAASDRRTMWNPMEATWMERYSATLDRLWSKLPNWMASTLITFIVFVFGVSIKGDWIIVAVHLTKQIGYYCTSEILPDTLYGNCSVWSDVSLETFYLKDLPTFWIYSSLVAYIVYFALGGFLHWYYYVRQRERPEEWKCQPYKWLSPELEQHEIIIGSISLMCVNTVSAVIACYLSNGGWSMVYYGFLDYGWFWLLFQSVFVFLYQDYTTYWVHRCYHLPFLYKNFHKLHHKYKQPTAFSVTAIHPVEIVSMQLVLCSPLFFCPVHWLPFYAIAFYTYYHGIIDHSGINFKAPWWQPWRPDTMFHDNHHQYFHVNFSFNIYYWDILHDTYRRPDRIYREHIFYGKGKAIENASEIQEEIDERLGENPNAHRSNEIYLLSEELLRKSTKTTKQK